MTGRESAFRVKGRGGERVLVDGDITKWNEGVFGVRYGRLESVGVPGILGGAAEMMNTGCNNTECIRCAE